MKITHYLDYQKKVNKKGSNQFKTKHKFEFKTFASRVGLVVLAITSLVVAGHFLILPVEAQNSPTAMFVGNVDICKGNSKCQAKIESVAKQILLEEEIKDLQTKVEAQRKSQLSNL